MQLCELQRVEDFEVVFEEDLAGPLYEEQTAIVEGATSSEQAAEAEDAASDEELADDVPVALDAGDTSQTYL